MSAKDPIKEIIDEFEEKISLYKKERDEAIANFKNAVHTKKIEDIKMNLKAYVFTQDKK